MPCDDPAGDAISLALDMRARMAELCASWQRLGHRLGFGVGISLGYATVGLVGSEGRYDYTASGTTVNLAARLEAISEPMQICVAEDAWQLLKSDFRGEELGEFDIKGFGTMSVYSLDGELRDLR